MDVDHTENGANSTGTSLSRRAVMAQLSALSLGVPLVCGLDTPANGAELAMELKTPPAPVTCTISTDAQVYRRGDKITLTMLIENRGIMTACYNPFLQDLIRPPGELQVFDAEGEYVGDMLHRSIGSWQTERGRHFVDLQAGGIIGVRKELTALKFSPLYVRPESVVPGFYRLQMSFSSTFLGAPYAVFTPDLEHSSTAVARAFTNVRRDVLRSNSIQIELKA